MTTPFNPELHVFHRAQVGAQTPLPPAPAGRELVNVWRVLDEKALREHGLVHGKTAFLEDHGHDWKLRRGGSLRYSTRQAEPGQWLDVLLDYQTPLEARMTARTALFRFDPMTGQPLANPSSEPVMRPAFDPSLHVLHTIKTGLKQANDLPPPPEGRELRRIWTVIDTSRLEELGPQHNLTGFLKVAGARPMETPGVDDRRDSTPPRLPLPPHIRGRRETWGTGGSKRSCSRCL